MTKDLTLRAMSVGAAAGEPPADGDPAEAHPRFLLPAGANQSRQEQHVRRHVASRRVDHVPPPTGPGWGERWRPGSRVPALVIGPGVKRGHVDSTSYDTASIPKLLTRRSGVEPLPGVRANAGDLSGALQ